MILHCEDIMATEWNIGITAEERYEVVISTERGQKLIKKKKKAE